VTDAAVGSRTWLLLVAALVLAAGVVISHGTLHPVTLAMVVLATTLVAVSAVPGIRPLPRPPLIAVLLVAQVPVWLVWVRRAVPRSVELPGLVTALVALAVLAVAATMAARAPRGDGDRAFAVLVLAAGVVGLLLAVGYGTGIDVLLFQEVSTGRLLDGIDPYGGVYEHHYSPEAVAQFYGPGVADDTTLYFGFPYPPISLLLVVPAALLGQVKLAHLAAVLIAGVAMWVVAEGDPRRRLGAIAFLTSPLPWFIVSQAWTEPFLVALLALLVMNRVRSGRFSPVLLGLFIGAKQYAVLLLPALLLLRDRPASARSLLRTLTLAAGLVAVLSLPFLLWNPQGLLYSVVELQFVQPYRPDALSLLAGSVELTGWPPAWTFAILPFAAVITVSALLLRRWWHEPSPHRAVVAAGLVLLTMFLVSKQAFANYYFLTFGILCLAIATAPQVTDGDAPGERTRSRPLPTTGITR